MTVRRNRLDSLIVGINKKSGISHLHQITEKSMAHDFTERFKTLTNGLDRGWQVDLSLRCGVSRPTITHWKSGRTKSASPAQLFAIADYFGVNARWLATGVGPKWLEAATSLENVSHVVNEDEPRVREC
jgi:transcriptional regulator with XRE-family HTH domain